MHWRHIISRDVDVQHGSFKSSIRRRHIFIADVDVQYGRGTPSVQGWVWSTDQSHHRYKWGCAVQDHKNCSGSCWWLYLSWNNILFSLHAGETINLSLSFKMEFGIGQLSVCNPNDSPSLAFLDTVLVRVCTQMMINFRFYSVSYFLKCFEMLIAL